MIPSGVLFLAVLAAGLAPAPAADDAALDRFGEEISVGLATVRVRLLDPSGALIPALKPEEVAVRIGRRRVPVVAVDYYDGAVSTTDEPDARVVATLSKERHFPHQVSARGQMFVFFVECDLKERDAPPDTTAHLQRLVDSLPAGALAAVVSFDTRLKLQLDLTRDRQAVYQAIVRGRQGGEPPAPPASPDPLSLRRSWPTTAPGTVPGTVEAKYIDQGLGITAAAFHPLPGEKVVIFLGNGPSRFSPPTYSEEGGLGTSLELQRTIRTLQRARGCVFVLDGARLPGQRDIPTLRLLTKSTGGAYLQARRAGREAAVNRLLKQTAGYHLVTFNLEQLEDKKRTAPLTVELVGRPGTVLAAPFRVVNLVR